MHHVQGEKKSLNEARLLKTPGLKPVDWENRRSKTSLQRFCRLSAAAPAQEVGVYVLNQRKLQKP